MGLTVPKGAISKADTAELLGCSERTVRRNLSDFDIACTRPALNGRDEPLIAVPSLPPAAQEQLDERARKLTPAPGQMALGITMPTGRNLSEEDQAETERRFKAIEPLVDPNKFRALRAQCHNRKCEVADYQAGQYGVKRSTIYEWKRRFEKGGVSALAPKDRADKGSPRVFNNAALDFLLAACLPKSGSYGALSGREIYRQYEDERVWRASNADRPLASLERVKYERYVGANGCLRPSAQLSEASYQTFLRWCERIPEVARVMAREGEAAFHDSQEIISFRALAEIRPLQYLVLDHRVLDIFCMVRTREGWRLVRPWLTAALDMRTRRWLGYVIVETPSSDSIASVLKRVFLDHGLPEYAYFDNGKDFRCEWLEGKHTHGRQSEKVGDLGESWRGVLATLGIRVTHAIVKRARSKTIEPNFLNIANFDRTLPEYAGHRPTARPERFDQMLEWHEAWLRGEREAPPFRTIEQVAALYTDFIEKDLNEREHSGEGMQKVTPTGRGWMCPNEAWEILTRRMERRTVDPDVLKFCFAKRRELVVRHGEVKTSFAGRDFHYRLNGNAAALAALNGLTVQFAFDPLDLGFGAWQKWPSSARLK